MTAELQTILDDCTLQPADKFTLKEWKEIFRTSGMCVEQDDSGESEETMFSSEEIKELVAEYCIVKACDTVETVEATLEDLESAKSLQEEIALAQEADAFSQQQGENRIQRPSEAEQVKNAIVADKAEYQEAIQGENRPPVQIQFKQVTPESDQEAMAWQALRRDTDEAMLQEADKQEAAPMKAPVFKGPTLVQARRLSVDEWRKRFKEYSRTLPINEFIGTPDGSPIRIDIAFHEGKPPVLSCFIYLSTIVGELAWHAEREGEVGPEGWKVIILGASRDKALKHLDLTKDYGLVRQIRVERQTMNGNALLGEIVEYVLESQEASQQDPKSSQQAD